MGSSIAVFGGASPMGSAKPTSCTWVADPGSLCVAVPVLARMLLTVATSHLAAIAGPNLAGVFRAILASSSFCSTASVFANI